MRNPNLILKQTHKRKKKPKKEYSKPNHQLHRLTITSITQTVNISIIN